MQLTLSYLGQSGLLLPLFPFRSQAPAPIPRQPEQVLSLAPNLARDRVAFDAPLLRPLRFREAMSALHDIVLSDLRFQRRDKTAYQEWKRAQAQLAAGRHAEASAAARGVVYREAGLPEGFELEHDECVRRYWSAVDEHMADLRHRDPQLWRLMLPYDPVITVAPDAVLFEAFSADESSYGCLTLDRAGGLGPADLDEPGTTNVDYSWDLYHHFQALRSYRETRLRIDPGGFEVRTTDASAIREEKIDVPTGWLRGFVQIQAATGLTRFKVSLTRDAVYSALAWLQRHRPRTSPRALRFELTPGQPPVLVLEPWEKRIVSATIYQGPPTAPIRVWGQRRLLALARVLPLAERFDVYLAGSGLPSFWVARMGEMRLTLGLSGWTRNDWTHGSALELLAPQAQASAASLNRVTEHLRRTKLASLPELAAAGGCSEQEAAAALHRLALAGQSVFDLDAGRHRWRQLLPATLATLDPEPPELLAARDLVPEARISESRAITQEATLYTGRVGNRPVELMLDARGGIRRGQCNCSHHFRSRLKRGPCRHLLALRLAAQATVANPMKIG